jgi:hypothetical protein
VLGAPKGDAEYAGNYRNQVNIWYSTNDGADWQVVDYMGSGFFSSPHYNTGFSDPDLTLDEAGNVYDTGIDLGNDALFSSPDGGITWPTGTVQCHDGDRPWLAGGKANEVFLATDTVEGSGSGHQVFHSGDAGASCDQTGITDNGKFGGGTYSGFGKLYYDHHNGSLVEPATFTSKKGKTGIGVSILRHASSAFKSGSKAAFHAHEGARRTTMLAHWPSIAIDAGDNYYVVWDTNPRKPKSSGGCAGAETPLANSIKMIYSKDQGHTWSKPITVAHPGTTVLWPWVAAGANGNVSVVWYQYDRVTDPDCGKGKVYVYDANIFHATNPSRRAIGRVNASRRPIHTGGICQGGTTCVATGQDRRLGDYFTNALDPFGCVLIATGDTTLKDPATGGTFPTARPLFLKQNWGRSLIGGQTCDRP